MRLLKAALDSTIEAVAVEKFNAELWALTTTRAERDDLREAALLIAKLGLTSKDIEPMARNYYLAGNRLKHLSAEISRYADELTPGRNA